MSARTPADPPNADRPFSNRLAQETSPYLLQHRHNPVDWYPWGPEAFDRARRENKPIFLSVGYSTCYWCHVMERQSFENAAIAALMNRLFVCVKVDREERPDVDQLYMTAVQLLTRHGGWPMSVWLTPDLRPFYGGTYYPPADAHGRPGFPRVCEAVADAWHNRPTEVAGSAANLVALVRRLARPAAADAASPVAVDPGLIGKLVDRTVSDYDPRFGGFGRVPKFPRQTALELLLSYLHSDLDETTTGGLTPKAKVRQMVLHALDAMANGGIRDHLGGGFHRYSTDAKWLVPHFEIMLYDNAMLLACYAEAYRLTGDARYAQVARDAADFVLREMTSPDGAFYTAFDAEVDHQEGLNYLWTPAEVREVLGAGDYERFARVYGLDQGFNFADPHHGSGVPDKNILYLADPAPGGRSALLDADLRDMRLKLLNRRQTRKQPLLDTKVLTSWNALMIRGLAVTGRVLDEPRYVAAAGRAADFLLARHRTPDGGLYRTSRDGSTKYKAFLDDYSYLAWALTELATATADPRWTREAKALMAAVDDRFGDPAAGDSSAGGYYFTDRSADDLIVRQKTAQDSPLPSGNAAAALAQTALGRHAAARQTLAAFAPAVVEHGEAMGSMVQAALRELAIGGPFTVGGPGPTPGPIAAELSPTTAPGSLAAEAHDVVSLEPRWLSPTELAVRVRVRDGWHVNAHDVAPGSGLVPTTLAVQPDDQVAGIGYPPGRPLAGGFADGPVPAYAGEVEVRVHFHAAPADTTLRLTLRYQACDESACLPPAAVTVEVR